ncbi:MAG: ABC transporter ATP-binding protein [Pseudodesulfovibrio sp.]|uniref:ABC transporter related protein n=1 Tax=Pseudodesulfovibrio aespoeensis (strain ATCC 700646 / DSM 10631 / Aspo-2) TaxID=643562 RepID=E6VVG2_PSEA9|nr:MULTISPECIES: ABC transporter ATP-binding protein [Pseudodesulfovibrio]MBU4193252.1 ABC transporter ATP-binding protein [Pseudomonadota bacterium]ADU62406.1 ABC transporter related protein [Pseudodesulfovibrio aespoeensis Aspo-2]MBU4244658.1 ABC transporter ATP-binding protein [Pseudomonadota bacterium]MBU4377797.1 ABC transporter ATP-binding protein [Pseudomonadota bacterium]MBU4473929.1 ABC transporter ATP-binding protein [Pseudomonadota bacterium]
MTHETVIQVRGLTKSFAGKVVVNGLDMEIGRGEIYGFLGPNGSGKTTSIRMLCGLLRPDSGSGTCLGHDILTQADRIKPHVGYMTQRFSLYEDLTVRENLDFAARVFDLEAPARVVSECIDRMALGRFEHHLAGNLSGGWKQRLSLGVSTLHSPRLLLLDEPTAGVDPGARRDFWDQVHILAAQGITALISTHYMDEAERCHRLAYIAYGDLLASGTVGELVADSGLTTWSVAADPAAGREADLHALSQRLKPLEGVDQVVAFGNTLHVSTRTPELAQRSMMPFQTAPYHWSHIGTSLEEVFIDLMQRSGQGRT